MKYAQRAICFLFLTALYIFFNQYDFLLGPQKYLAIQILSVQNPALFLGSEIMRLQNEAFFSLLGWLLAFMNRWIDLDWLFFIGHFITTFFYLHGVFMLSKIIFKDEFAAFISVLALFVIKPVLIDASLYPTYFYHRNVALAFQIYAVCFFFLGRFRITGLLLGLAFNISAYATVHVIFILAFVSLIEFKKLPWNELIKGGLIFSIVASPTLIWRVAASESAPLGFVSQEWIYYLKETSAIYVFPSSLFNFKQGGGINTLLMAFVWPFFFLALFFKGCIHFNGIYQTVSSLMIGILVLFTVGTVFSELIPVSTVMQLMSFRAHRFFVLFSIIFFSFYLVKRFREENTLLFKALVTLMLVSFLSSKMILCTILLFADFLVLALNAKSKIRKVFLISVISFLLLTTFVLQIHFPILERLFHLNFSFWIVSILSLLSLRMISLMKEIRASWIIFAGAFMFLILPSYWGYGQNFWLNPTLYASKQIEWPGTPHLDEEKRELFRWIRENTPEKAVFVTPLFDSDFSRYFAIETKRAELLSSEGVFTILSFTFAQKWHPMMKSFEWFPEETFSDRYLKYSDEKIKSLREQYHFDYLITKKEAAPLGFPVVYSSEKHLIYEINEG